YLKISFVKYRRSYQTSSHFFLLKIFFLSSFSIDTISTNISSYNSLKLTTTYHHTIIPSGMISLF
ncbi:unnamed protein product, partial [Brassica napus]